MQNDSKRIAKKLLLGTLHMYETISVYTCRVRTSSGCSNKRIYKQ